MYEFTCEYCGTVKIVKYKSEVGRYCSYSCANKGRNPKKIEVDMTYDWKCYKFGSQKYFVCRYNENISCQDRNCAACGWNPAVARARTELILKQRKAVTL